MAVAAAPSDFGHGVTQSPLLFCSSLAPDAVRGERTASKFDYLIERCRWDAQQPSEPDNHQVMPGQLAAQEGGADAQALCGLFKTQEIIPTTGSGRCTVMGIGHVPLETRSAGISDRKISGNTPAVAGGSFQLERQREPPADGALGSHCIPNGAR